jgi:protein SCO1/2
MRTRTIIALAAILFAAGCGSDVDTDTRLYELKGQVLVVKPETNEILVKHEDIAGFMPAMTMPYTVRNPAELKDRIPGDLITATLIVEKAGTPYLQSITKTGSAPLPEDARTTIPAAAGVHVLKAGDTVPGTALVDQDGAAITLASFRGSALAVSFIYTRCPLPQFCPLIDRRFGEVQKLADGDSSLKGKVKLLSISFDPTFDRAEVLRAHAKTVGADPNVWRFATAEEAVVDRLAAEFGINVIREQDGTITHNLRTAVIDPSGHVVSIVDNNAWTAGELVAALKNAVAAAR